MQTRQNYGGRKQTRDQQGLEWKELTTKDMEQFWGNGAVLQYGCEAGYKALCVFQSP